MKLLFAIVFLLIISCVTTSLHLIGESRPAISRSDVKKYKIIPQGAEEMGTVQVNLQSNFGGAEARTVEK